MLYYYFENTSQNNTDWNISNEDPKGFVFFLISSWQQQIKKLTIIDKNR